MKGIPECIAFSSLAACATALEITGNGWPFLWLIIVCWVIFTDWGQENENTEN